MPFAIALSGLNAASSDLSVTANNIANVNTNGFKGSRAQFAEVFAVGTQSVSSSAAGSGVRLSTISQQFTRATSTSRTTRWIWRSVARVSSCSATTAHGPIRARVRSGSTTRVSSSMLSSSGCRLIRLPAAVCSTPGTPTDLQLVTGANPPEATTRANFGLNLPANAPLPANATFDPLDPSSFNHTTSVTVYDSLGAAHTATVYFIKDAAPQYLEHAGRNRRDRRDRRDAYRVCSRRVLADAGWRFDAAGCLHALHGCGGHLDVARFRHGDPVRRRLRRELLVAGRVYDGRLTGISVDAEGVVFARFTNGQSTSLGKLALANFVNAQGLQQLGDTTWGESFSSGDALLGEAGTASFGSIQSGALEASNVDLTAQLVNMITAQRNFQANAQMISTADTVTQTVINIR